MRSYKHEEPPYYLSTYSLAVQRGFQGTIDEWLESIKGEKGETGKSAYEYAVEGGYRGTEEAFREKQSVDGKGAYEYAVEGGYTGTAKEFSQALGKVGQKITVCGKAANTAGNIALTASDVKALSTSGGTVNGNIAMSGKKITGLGDPVNDTDATGKKYVLDKIAESETPLKSISVNIPKTKWASAEEGYTASISVSGMTADWIPGIPVLETKGSRDADLAAREALSRVSKIESGAGKVIFTCYEKKPETDITVRLPGLKA